MRIDFEMFVRQNFVQAKIIYPTSEPAMGAVFLAIDACNCAVPSV